MARVLVVDDEEAVLTAVERRLSRDGHTVETTSDAAEGIRLIREAKLYDVIVTDMSMQEERSGLEVLRAAFNRDLFSQVIVMTAYGTVENAVESLKRGAFDYIEKNAPNVDVYEQLSLKVQAAVEQRTRDNKMFEKMERLAAAGI